MSNNTLKMTPFEMQILYGTLVGQPQIRELLEGEYSLVGFGFVKYIFGLAAAQDWRAEKQGTGYYSPEARAERNLREYRAHRVLMDVASRIMW